MAYQSFWNPWNQQSKQIAQPTSPPWAILLENSKHSQWLKNVLHFTYFHMYVCMYAYISTFEPSFRLLCTTYLAFKWHNQISMTITLIWNLIIKQESLTQSIRSNKDNHYIDLWFDHKPREPNSIIRNDVIMKFTLSHYIKLGKNKYWKICKTWSMLSTNLGVCMTSW